MKRLLKLAVVMAVASAGAWGLGLILARRFERGAGFAEADEFRIAAFWGGREFGSTAPALRSGWAVAVLGGVALDLRDATLAPEGASLSLRATMGGMAVTVPEGWRVIVEKDVTAGAVDVRTADPDDLPADAPTLHVTAAAQSGGIVISTSEDD